MLTASQDVSRQNRLLAIALRRPQWPPIPNLLEWPLEGYDKPRETWNKETWRAYALFLEARGASLAEEIGNLRALVPPRKVKKKPGPKPRLNTRKQNPIAGLFGMFKAAPGRPKGFKGERLTEEQMAELLNAMDTFQEKKGLSRAELIRSFVEFEVNNGLIKRQDSKVRTGKLKSRLSSLAVRRKRLAENKS